MSSTGKVAENEQQLPFRTYYHAPELGRVAKVCDGYFDLCELSLTWGPGDDESLEVGSSAEAHRLAREHATIFGGPSEDEYRGAER
jgi:hypothetical protein